MKVLLWLMALLITSSGAQLFAATWSGPLVDSDCYLMMQQNTSADAGFTGIDISGRIRNCAATMTTTSFAIVQPNTLMLRFNGAGNEKALFLMQTTRGTARVRVSGKRSHNLLEVDDIELAK